MGLNGVQLSAISFFSLAGDRHNGVTLSIFKAGDGEDLLLVPGELSATVRHAPKSPDGLESMRYGEPDCVSVAGQKIPIDGFLRMVVQEPLESPCGFIDTRAKVGCLRSHPSATDKGQ